MVEGNFVHFSEDSFATKNKVTITKWSPAYFNNSVWSKVQLRRRC